MNRNAADSNVQYIVASIAEHVLCYHRLCVTETDIRYTNHTFKM